MGSGCTVTATPFLRKQPDGGESNVARATAALHSEMWRILSLSFMVAILDEGQKVNKRGTQIHDTFKNSLQTKAFVILSGTLPQYKWHNMSGYIDSGTGHS